MKQGSPRFRACKSIAGDKMTRFFMREALKEAESFEIGEVVGAVIERHGRLSEGTTVRRRERSDCHAEIIAIRQAAEGLGLELLDSNLYVTTEPCSICPVQLSLRGSKRCIGTMDPKRSLRFR